MGLSHIQMGAAGRGRSDSILRTAITILYIIKRTGGGLCCACSPSLLLCEGACSACQSPVPSAAVTYA
jgi:predicted amidophosphoribosyltransferase